MIAGHSGWGIRAPVGELNRLRETPSPVFLYLDCVSSYHNTLRLVPNIVLIFELSVDAVQTPRVPLGNLDFYNEPPHHELAVYSLVFDWHKVGLDLLLHYDIRPNFGNHKSYLLAYVLFLGLRKIEADYHSPLIKGLLYTNEDKPSLIVQEAANGPLQSLLV